MEVTENWLSMAKEKLSGEEKEVTGQKEKAMAAAVLQVIRDFCEQEPEFAQAVVQGGSFSECMRAVAKNVGSSISDIEAYKRAVEFYFPGAKIHVQMRIDLIGDAAEAIQEPEGPMILNLQDFF